MKTNANQRALSTDQALSTGLAALTGLALSTGLAVLFVGCRGDSQDQAVSVQGLVTVAGQPLSGAIISWEPIGSTPGPKASAPIFNGQYRIESSADLRAGEYRVRISMMPREMLKKLETQEPIQLPRPGQVIAREFDSNSQLVFQLQAGAHHQADWEVTFQ